MSKDINKQIADRRKEAVKKGFYSTGQSIVASLGKKNVYDDGQIRIENSVFEQQYTGGSDDIEIFFNKKSVFVGRGNEYTSFGEDGIDRYVPGEWEQNLEEIAQRIKVSTPKQRDDTLQKDWGISPD